MQEEESKRAKEKAMSLLLINDRTKKELMDRLYRAGFSEQASEEALQYVESFGYINDSRYATNYIRFRKIEKSKKEIRYKLLQKGVDSEVISLVFEEVYEGEEEAFFNSLNKKLRGRKVDELTDLEKRKLSAYLGRRGFSVPLIRKNLF